MAEFFEAIMVISFGASWPMSIYKSYKARTAKGKSVAFLILIMFGYVCGIVSKILSGKITYVFIFYVINLVAVFIDFCFYLRNRKIDLRADEAVKE